MSFDAFHPFAFGKFSAAASGAPTGEVELETPDLRQPIKGNLTVPVAGLRIGRAQPGQGHATSARRPTIREIRYRIDKVESSFPSLAENTDVILTIHGVLIHRGYRAGRRRFAGRVRLKPGGSLWVRGRELGKAG